MADIRQRADFIWGIAELLRGDYKQSEYGKVILPLTVLRRLDCVLEKNKQKVLDYLPKVEQMKLENSDPILNKVAGLNFHNKSKFDFPLAGLFFYPNFFCFKDAHYSSVLCVWCLAVSVL